MLAADELTVWIADFLSRILTHLLVLHRRTAPLLAHANGCRDYQGQDERSSEDKRIRQTNLEVVTFRVLLVLLAGRFVWFNAIICRWCIEVKDGAEGHLEIFEIVDRVAVLEENRTEHITVQAVTDEELAFVLFAFDVLE